MARVSLTSNVNSGKHDTHQHFRVLRLNGHAIMFHLAIFSVTECIQSHEIGYNNFGSWIQVSGILAGSCAVTDKLERKRGNKCNRLQQKLMMHLPYFGQDLGSEKRVAGILAYICFDAVLKRCHSSTCLAARHGLVQLSSLGCDVAAVTSES